MCDAVQYMHSNSIAHLDIKAENVIIDNRLNIQIIDLGLGMVVDETRQIPYKGRVGTPTHMPPEMLQHW